MADRKISDLTALTTPAAGDFLPIVDISEAAAASKNKRITIEELLRGAPDGTAAAPSIAFESDPDTGIYSAGANQLAISTNGARRLYIDSSGALTVDTGDAYIYGVRVGRGAGAISFNTAVGSGALNSNTTGNYNTANGYQSLYANTTGNSNTANGQQALYSNIGGEHNTAIGRWALYSNTEGDNNIAIGFAALYGNNGSNNVAYGYQALNINTTGTNNTALGHNAGSALTTGSNNTIIGNITGTAGLANTVIIGAGSTERLRIDSSGRVGIGTTTAARNATTTIKGASSSIATGNAQLSIITSDSQAADKGGSIALGGQSTDADWIYGSISGRSENNSYAGYLAFATSASGGQHNERLRITSAGLVGIGTTSPTVALDVVGGINASSTLGVTGVSTLWVVNATASSSTVLTLNRTTTDGDIATFNVGGTPCFVFNNVGARNISVPGANPLAFNTNSLERARIDSSGRLLLGTSTARPIASSNNHRIQVEVTDGNAFSAIGNSTDQYGSYIRLAKSRGSASGSNTIVQSGDELGAIFWGGADGVDVVSQAASITALVDGTPGANDMPGRLVFSTTADGAASPTERMRIDSGGNMGLGVTPTAVGGVGRTFQYGSNQLLQNVVSSQGCLSSNALYKAVDGWTYIAAGRACALRLQGGIDGGFTFNVSNAVGTAGGTIASWDGNSALNIHNTGACAFPMLGTTASAANAFLDGAGGNFLRSTSSLRYKTNVEDLEQDRSTSILDFRPVWYRSTAEADRKDWSWYGLIAEEVAEIEPRLVHWTYLKDAYEEVDGERQLKPEAKMVPDGVQYDRLTVLLLDVVKRQQQAIKTLEQRLTDAGIA